MFSVFAADAIVVLCRRMKVEISTEYFKAVNSFYLELVNTFKEFFIGC